MGWFLQTPHQQQPKTLGAILDHCDGAAKGGAAFAFASSSGLKLLADEDVFRDFLKSSDFTLVVGLDAITDEKAVAALKAWSGKFPKLSVKLFLHDEAGVIFHPKTLWFRKADGTGIVITGSGNLTAGGLKSNWEALFTTALSAAQTIEIEKSWQSWLDAHKKQLLDPDNPKVAERAKANRIQRARVRKVLTTAAGGEEALAELAQDALQDADMKRFLIAEVPKSGNRWSQVNFDVRTYQDFFGVALGAGKDVEFRHVRDDGSKEAAEQRHGVAVKSQNYRFEIGAAKGQPYPKQGHPIVIFERITESAFCYLLLMPPSAAHALVQKFLDAHYPKTNQKRRETISEVTLRSFWPVCPLLD